MDWLFNLVCAFLVGLSCGTVLALVVYAAFTAYKQLEWVLFIGFGLFAVIFGWSLVIFFTSPEVHESNKFLLFSGVMFGAILGRMLERMAKKPADNTPK